MPYCNKTVKNIIQRNDTCAITGLSQKISETPEKPVSCLLGSHFLPSFHFQPSLNLLQESELEKAVAPHSSTLDWKIPWLEEPGRLQSMGLLRVGHDWATALSLFTFMLWRRKWQHTPVFLPGESQGQRRLLGCRLWHRTESDMTKAT